MNKNLALVVGVVLIGAALLFFIFNNSTPSDVDHSSEISTASDDGAYREGVHYRTVSDSIPAAGKIQVQEFFWYGCPHCQQFEPAVREYRDTLTDDAELVQIPVVWNEATGVHGAVHYLAVQMNASDDLHDELFAKFIALRREGNLDTHIQEAKSLFAAHGIDTSDFDTNLRSDNIQSQLEESSRLMKAAGITSTPTMMVDNKWVLENNEEVFNAGLFNVVNFLVEKARLARQ